MNSGQSHGNLAADYRTKGMSKQASTPWIMTLGDGVDETRDKELNQIVFDILCTRRHETSFINKL